MKQTRNTRQRRLVAEAVKARKNHPTADEIYMDARERDEKISRGTVYRNLNLLAESGEIAHVRVPSADRYDFRLDRHYHVFCTGCGAVCDAPMPYAGEYDRMTEEATGFRISRHRTVFEGLCPECQKKEFAQD